MLTLAHSLVSCSPKVRGGTLVFRGTRVPAQTLLDYLGDGFSLQEFLKYFPSVQCEEARDFLTLSRGEKPWRPSSTRTFRCLCSSFSTVTP